MELRHIWVCPAGKNGTLLHDFWRFIDPRVVCVSNDLDPATTSFVAFFSASTSRLCQSVTNLYLPQREVFHLTIPEEHGKESAGKLGQKRWCFFFSFFPIVSAVSLHPTSYKSVKPWVNCSAALTINKGLLCELLFDLLISEPDQSFLPQ